MQHIGCKAVADFETLRLSSPLVRERQRQSMNNSIERANIKLNQPDLPHIPFVLSNCMYEVGAVVRFHILIPLYIYIYIHISPAATTSPPKIGCVYTRLLHLLDMEEFKHFALVMECIKWHWVR